MKVFVQIKKLCGEKGIKIRQLEQNAQIGNGVIAKWKKSSPQVDSLSKVADYFDVSLDYLTDRTNVRKIEDVKAVEGQELESLVKTLLSELDSQNLTFDNEPIDVNMVEIIKNMLTSNLEVWRLMNQQKSEKLQENNDI